MENDCTRWNGYHGLDEWPVICNCCRTSVSLTPNDFPGISGGTQRHGWCQRASEYANEGDEKKESKKARKMNPDYDMISVLGCYSALCREGLVVFFLCIRTG